MDLKEQITRLRANIEAEHFTGYDPYDALNSPILNSLSFKNKYLRIAFIQAMKKSPVNFRALLGTKKGINPKGLGLILWGYAKLFVIEKKPEYLERIDQILDVLEVLKSKYCSGNGWGYNFDWQSRAFFVPKFTPTVVNSSFIGHALLDAYRLAGSERALCMALPITDFILNDLNRLEENGTICFSYTPIDRYFVHNANLLGASLLIRVCRHSGRKEEESIALRSLGYSMSHQHKDGSWFYAEKEGSDWIDSFHTGFNLQAIRYFLDEGHSREYKESLDRGVRFYAENFFLENGTPKYCHDRIYPIDIHSPAQALMFFSGEGEQYRGLTEKVLNWTVSNMYNKKGIFYFQKHRLWTNRITYMRWSQAWMFHALAEYYLNYSF